MTESKTTLLPCPFCGNKNIRDCYIRDGREVYCNSCSARVLAYNPEGLEHASEKWNRRHTIIRRVERPLFEITDDTP